MNYPQENRLFEKPPQSRECGDGSKFRQTRPMTGKELVFNTCQANALHLPSRWSIKPHYGQDIADAVAPTVDQDVLFIVRDLRAS